MSLEVLEPERGDDRDPEISVERLEEMFNQPDAEERMYVSDTPGVGIGELAPIHRRHDRYPVGLSHLVLRQVHIRPSVEFPDRRRH